VEKLYRKSEVWFAVAWIIAYCVLLSVADELSRLMGVEKAVTLPVCILLSGSLLLFIRKHGLWKKYGLCRPSVPAKKLLLYLPLVVIVSVNLWFGVGQNLSAAETVLYILSMCFVGFLEEIIFRGLLFQAMRKDSEKAAVMVSSVTFGIGHIINLINGSGADLLSNLLQVCYAISIGFLFVMIFCKTGSLVGCIVTHSAVNALSAFSNEAAMTPGRQIFTAAVLTVIPLVYCLYLHKKVKTNAV